MVDNGNHRIQKFTSEGASLDPDHDGYTNIEEYKEGGDPNNPDTPFPWELFYPAFIKKK